MKKSRKSTGKSKIYVRRLTRKNKIDTMFYQDKIFPEFIKTKPKEVGKFEPFWYTIKDTKKGLKDRSEHCKNLLKKLESKH